MSSAPDGDPMSIGRTLGSHRYYEIVKDPREFTNDWVSKKTVHEIAKELNRKAIPYGYASHGVWPLAKHSDLI